MTATLFLLLAATGILGPVYAQLQQSGGAGSTVTANQGGTWNLTNIAGTVSLRRRRDRGQAARARHCGHALGGRDYSTRRGFDDRAESGWNRW
jgi:hypothetical protein